MDLVPLSFLFTYEDPEIQRGNLTYWGEEWEGVCDPESELLQECSTLEPREVLSRQEGLLYVLPPQGT